MRTITSLLTVLALLMAACGEDGTAEPTTVPPDATIPDEWQRGQEVFVTGTGIDIRGAEDPTEVFLTVSGDLPTPCHVPLWEVDTESDTVAVVLESAYDPDQVCAQVLEPFEVTIDLGDYTDGSYVVTLNGERVGEFTA